MKRFKVKFDFIISGVGPSGSHCAELFAKKGFKIALIENDFFRAY